MNTLLVYAVAIGVLLAVWYGVARVMSRREEEEQDSAFGPPAEIRVLTRARMGRGCSLVVVEVQGRRLLLGSTRSEWRALADLGAISIEAEPNPFAPIDAELARAIQATRFPRGRKRSG